MSETLEIRLAGDEELVAVGDLTLAAYVAEGFLSAEDAYSAELQDAAHRAREAELYVAVLAEELVGTVTFCPPGSPLGELSADGEGEFRMLVVKPAARGRGVARALVDRCFARCRELRLSGIVLCSMTTMTPAHALYRSVGFARDESLDWQPTPGVTLWGYRARVRP